MTNIILRVVADDHRRWVEHAFDVIAKKDGKIIIAECKEWTAGRMAPLITMPHHGARQQKPPRAAERFLEFIPVKYREHLVGDLEEMYRSHVLEYGLEEAQRWYWQQVALSFVPIIWSIFKELVGLASLLKLIN